MNALRLRLWACQHRLFVSDAPVEWARHARAILESQLRAARFCLLACYDDSLRIASIYHSVWCVSYYTCYQWACVLQRLIFINNTVIILQLFSDAFILPTEPSFHQRRLRQQHNMLSKHVHYSAPSPMFHMWATGKIFESWTKNTWKHTYASRAMPFGRDYRVWLIGFALALYGTLVLVQL